LTFQEHLNFAVKSTPDIIGGIVMDIDITSDFARPVAVGQLQCRMSRLDLAVAMFDSVDRYFLEIWL
jgi:hypothetical protein